MSFTLGWDPYQCQVQRRPTLALECLLQRVSSVTDLLLLMHLGAANGLFGTGLHEILFDIGVVFPGPVWFLGWYAGIRLTLLVAALTKQWEENQSVGLTNAAGKREQ